MGWIAKSFNFLKIDAPHRRFYFLVDELNNADDQVMTLSSRHNQLY